MRVKNCSIKIKAAGEQDGTDDGTFEAIVATYDLDSYGDRIVPGAFADTLAAWQAKGDPIPVLWSHQAADPDAHIGVVLDARETDDGLWVKGQLDLDAPKAAQVYRLLKGRRVTQFSFAYDVDEGAWIEKSDEPPFYELRKLSLYEVGPCLIGVNQQTELLAVKAADGRDLDLELRGRAIAPGEGEVIRRAVEAALGAVDGSKAGRTLSAKNETALREAVDQISAGVKGVKSVLDSIGGDDASKGAAPTSQKTETTEAKPDRPAADEEPNRAKSDAPAGPRPASLCRSAEADLLALAAEFGD